MGGHPWKLILWNVVIIIYNTDKKMQVVDVEMKEEIGKKKTTGKWKEKER